MVGIGFVFAALLLLIVNQLVSEKADEERRHQINNLGYFIQDELLLAESVHDGYERTFTVPQTLGKFPYTINSTTTSITIMSGKMTTTFTIPTITGSIQKGANTINKDGSITIT